MLTYSRRCRLDRCPGRQGFPHGDSWRILAVTSVVHSLISSLPVHCKRCRAHHEIGHEWHVEQATPKRQAVWCGESRRMFNLSVRASLTNFVRQVGCLATCGMRSWKSCTVSQRRMACGRGASCTQCLCDIVVALPSWAAMNASHSKRVRTQRTVGCAVAVSTSLHQQTLAGRPSR